MRMLVLVLMALNLPTMAVAQPKPAPAVQATPLPDDQVALEHDGKEITRLVPKKK